MANDSNPSAFSGVTFHVLCPKCFNDLPGIQEEKTCAHGVGNVVCRDCGDSQFVSVQDAWHCLGHLPDDVAAHGLADSVFSGTASDGRCTRCSLSINLHGPLSECPPQCGICNYILCGCKANAADRERMSPRWHYEYEGRTYIIYAMTETQAEDIANAKHKSGNALIGEMKASGFYSYMTNQILEAKDGETLVIDNIYAPRKRTA